MTQEEHLNRIVAKCRELLENSFFASESAKAGWRATIAAIEVMGDIKPLHALNPNDEGLDCLCSDCCRTRHQWAARDTIIAAWPEELL